MQNGHDMHHSSTANSIMYLLIGATIGATAMLLCSPASGSEVRSKIAEKATDLKDRAGEWTGMVAERAEQFRDKAVSTAHNTLDRAVDSLQGMEDRVDGQKKQPVRA